MGAVTLTSDWPPASGPMTVADLDRTPDDGRRYELVDGVLVVSPAPLIPHQVVLHKLAYLLEAALPDHLDIVPGPGLRMSETTELVPDLTIVRHEELSGRHVSRPPVLVVEVRSQSTALFDMNVKKAVYERFGIPSYWIVVPDREEPRILAYELRDGSYELAGEAKNDQEFKPVKPFAVTITPAQLVARLRA